MLTPTTLYKTSARDKRNIIGRQIQRNPLRSPQSTNVVPSQAESIYTHTQPKSLSNQPTKTVSLSLTVPNQSKKKGFWMAEKEGGVVKKGQEEGLKLAVSLLQEFELPEGLLPLQDVVEVGHVKGTGYMWIVQKKKVEHDFKMIKKLVSYDSEITGYVSKKKIKKLKGVKAKELMLWPPVSEITVDDPPTGKIHFKSLAGITKTFPVEAFAAGQWHIHPSIHACMHACQMFLFAWDHPIRNNIPSFLNLYYICFM